MERYVSPHLELHIRATTICTPDVLPQEVATITDLRRLYDLGAYKIEELEDLLTEVSDAITEWVGNHPPTVMEPEAENE